MEVARSKPRRFTAEQKYQIIQDVESMSSRMEGLTKYGLAPSTYHGWKKQLEVGIRSSLRGTKPKKDIELRRLEKENRQLKEALLNQSLMVSQLKKEMNLD